MTVKDAQSMQRKKYRRSGGNVTTVIGIAHHRNGIVGAPFFVVRFTDSELREQGEMVAVVFPNYANSNIDDKYYASVNTAVLNVAQLAEGDIAFGSNSWRGDHWSDVLCQAINDWCGAS